MSLLLDELIDRNPDALVTITHDRLGISLVGIISDPQLVQSLSASYGDGAKGSVATASSMMGGSKNKFVRGIGSALEMANKYQTSKSTLMGTLKLYEGSGDISIPFNVQFFYGWHNNPGFKEMDRQFNLFTQPRKISGGFIGSNLYTASELAKTLALNTEALKGRLPNVSLGSWFLATDVYLTSISKNMSTVLNEDGKPAALQVTFQISPYRQLTAEELSNWILE